MIAADTSAWIDYAKGVESPGSLKVERALGSGTLVLPMPVLFEILSGPGLSTTVRDLIVQLPQLELVEGYWERAAEMRRRLLRADRRANAMDTLIAQNCIDHDIGLIVSDRDFRHFTRFGLLLA